MLQTPEWPEEVAGEARAGAGVLTHVAEHHGGDADGGAQVGMRSRGRASVFQGANTASMPMSTVRGPRAGLFLDDALEKLSDES